MNYSTSEALSIEHTAFYTANTPCRHDRMNSYSTSWWSLLLIYRPREDERPSWPYWLTYSGRFTHINGYPSAAGLVQTSESSPVRDRRSTTELPTRNRNDGSEGRGVHSMRGNWCRVFVPRCPSSCQPVLNTSTGCHSFFNHQHTLWVKGRRWLLCLLLGTSTLRKQ